MKVKTMGYVLVTPEPHPVIVDIGLDKDSFIEKQIKDCNETGWSELQKAGYTIRKVQIKETTDAGN